MAKAKSFDGTTAKEWILHIKGTNPDFGPEQIKRVVEARFAPVSLGYVKRVLRG